MKYPYTKSEKLEAQWRQVQAQYSAAIGTKSRAEVKELEVQAEKLYAQLNVQRDRERAQEWQRCETRWQKVESLIRQLSKKER